MRGRWNMKIKRITNSILVVSLIMCNITSAYALKAEQFIDYVNGAWYNSAINYCVDNGWMIGNTFNEIEPDREITRAEFATIVDRVFDTYMPKDISNYTDINEEDWYYNYMAMSVQMGIIEGVSDTELNPLGKITREQAMTILSRALALPEPDLEEEAELLKRFSDADDISDWACTYVASMVKEKRAQGYLDGTMRPLNNITRSETAQLLMNCIPNIEKGSNAISKKYTSNVLMLKNNNETEYKINNSQFEDMLLFSVGMADSVTRIYSTDIARMVCWGNHDIYIYPGCRIEEIAINRVDGPCIVHWMGDSGHIPSVSYGKNAHPDCDFVDKDGNSLPAFDDRETPKTDKPTTGGGGGSRPVHYPTAYFDPQNGQGRTSQRIGVDNKIQPITEPTREGYVFSGWYWDKECTRKFSFTQEVVDYTTLYGGWYTTAEAETIEKLNQMVSGSQVSIYAETDIFGIVDSNTLDIDIKNNESNGHTIKVDLVVEGVVIGTVSIESGNTATVMNIENMPEFGNYEAKLVITRENGDNIIEMDAMLYVAYMWKR